MNTDHDHIPEWVRNAKVGDKVVAIKQPNKTRSGAAPPPLNLGGVYTIETIKLDNWCKSGAAFVSKEDPSRWVCFGLFRPVSKKSTNTGITILKSILNGSPIQEDA